MFYCVFLYTVGGDNIEFYERTCKESSHNQAWKKQERKLETEFSGWVQKNLLTLPGTEPIRLISDTEVYSVAN